MQSGFKRVPRGSMQFAPGFWADKIALIATRVLPYQWKALNDEIPGAEPSHAVENFRIAAGESKDAFKGRIFQDSDVAKWIEAACYSLSVRPDSGLEKTLDSLIALIGRAQGADGYLNTYFTVAEPGARWSNFCFGHELYCAGHLIEAGVAHHQATGKDSLLKIVSRYADYIDRTIGPEEGKIHAYPGHPEIELALVKLYRETGEKRYLRLAEYFIDERGRQPCFFEKEKAFGGDTPNDMKPWFRADYHLAQAPVRAQTEATGHAVRAMYLYSAMADIAAETGDASLVRALDALWHNVTRSQMYVTGGLGSQDAGERFTVPYDLPNDSAYTETCAAVGLVMWSSRMLTIAPKGEYGDIMERALYNNVLSGISLDGTKYFYVNPLEVAPRINAARYDLKHVAVQRVPWFGCACCPPNIARLIASLGDYLCVRSSSTIYFNIYAPGEYNFDGLPISEHTAYPADGAVSFTVGGSSSLSLALRIPSWCQHWSCMVNGRALSSPADVRDGYLFLAGSWKKGDRIELRFEMKARFIRANPLVSKDAGMTALERGPLVYCLEETDNGPNLQAIVVDSGTALEEKSEAWLPGGIVSVSAFAQREKTDPEAPLYSSLPPEREAVRVKFTPYYVWNNRGPGEMRVWIREEKRVL